MELTLVKYPNIKSKLKALHSKRINLDDLNDLIKQNSLKNLVLLLKSKSNIFKNADDNIDRLEIESLLDESQIQDILKIKKLLHKKDRIIFEQFLLQYEIKCIKSMLRKLFSEDETDDIIIKNVRRWTVYLFEDIKGIETVKSFKEFFGAIKRMKYSSVLNEYQNKEKINIFEIENKIDKMYFESLFDSIKHNKNLKQIVGSEIDLLNVLWIYRLKKYYNFNLQEVRKILINKTYMLKKGIIEKLIKTSDFDEIKQIMKNTIYKKIFTNEDDFEDNIDKYLYSVNKKIFNQDVTSIAYIFAYVNLIDYENNDIVNTIEGVRYNMEKEQILKRLAQAS